MERTRMKSEVKSLKPGVRKDESSTRRQNVGVLLTLLAAVLHMNTGHAGMSSLKVMPGVREAGMGGVGVAAGFGPQAIAWNPAASAEVNGFGACASYTKWLLDAHQQSLYLVRGVGPANLGVGVTSFSAGDFEYRTDPTEEPLGKFAPGEMVFHIAVSRRMARMVQAGFAARYYYSKVMDRTATGVGFDLGARVMPLSRLTLGASLADFGWNLSYYRERFRLPTRARLGAAYQLGLGNGFALNGACEGAMYVYTRKFNVGAGAELVWNEMVALRAGYGWLDTAGRFGFGLGLRRGPFRVDYALTPLNDDLGTAHRFGIGLGE